MSTPPRLDQHPVTLAAHTIQNTNTAGGEANGVGENMAQLQRNYNGHRGSPNTISGSGTNSGTTTPNGPKYDAIREKLLKHATKSTADSGAPLLPIQTRGGEGEGAAGGSAGLSFRGAPSPTSPRKPAKDPRTPAGSPATPSYSPNVQPQQTVGAQSSSASSDNHRIAGILTVRLIAARHLKPMENGRWFGVTTSSTSNPYCLINLGAQVVRSSVINGDLNPRWSREQFFFDVTLPPSQAIAPVIGAVGTHAFRPTSPKDKLSAGSERTPSTAAFLFDPYNPLVSIKMFHRPSHPSEHARVDDPTEFKKEHGTLIGETTFDPVEVLLGTQSSFDGWLSLGDGSGEVRISVDYDAKGLTPRVGDLVRPVGFGTKFAQLLYPLEVVMTVQDIRGEYVLVSYLTPDEGWELFLELHRNAIFVMERSNIVTQAYSLVIKQAAKIQHSFIGESASKVYDALPPNYQKWVFIGATVAKQTALYTFEVLKQGVTEWNKSSWEAGWDSVKAGASVSLELLKSDYDLSKQSAEQDIAVAQTAKRITGTGGRKKPGPAQIAGQDGEAADDEIDDQECPSQLICPITGVPMKDPVVAADGHTYDRPAIEKWFASHNTSPMTGVPLPTLSVFPNYSLRMMVLERKEALLAARKAGAPLGSMAGVSGPISVDQKPSAEEETFEEPDLIPISVVEEKAQGTGSRRPRSPPRQTHPNEQQLVTVASVDEDSVSGGLEDTADEISIVDESEG